MEKFKKILGITTHIDLVDDLVVDLLQGSKRTLINCISPHIYKNKERIINWARKEIKEGRLELKTTSYKDLINSKLKINDLLMAYSYYYYNSFPDESKEKERLEEENGIIHFTNTFSTGVALTLVNANKLDTENMDKSIGFEKPISKKSLNNSYRLYLWCAI